MKFFAINSQSFKFYVLHNIHSVGIAIVKWKMEFNQLQFCSFELKLK